MKSFSLHIATTNGTGSQSANQTLTKALFRMGLYVGSKNIFPSNIAGLPTWYNIRINNTNNISRSQTYEILMAMNTSTLVEDLKSLSADGVCIYNQDLKLDEQLLKNVKTKISIPFKEMSRNLEASVKIKKLLTNMIYVGVIAELIGLDQEILYGAIKDQFIEKPSVVALNISAAQSGVDYVKEHLPQDLRQNFAYKVKKQPPHKNKIMIDGNTAGALGLVYGGCSFLSWYPITPSSSIAENFQKYANQLRTNTQGEKTFAIIQAEDELSAISMVIGAGWTGVRALTPTSGPGLSLMAEAAGLSYFAEIPAVIWNVQRVGPSTGLPTRTMQGDLKSAYQLSHGDTEHIILLPATPQECFEFGQTCFDLAESFQTLVIILSDLDLGMNLWISDKFESLDRPFHRGKVLTKQDTQQLESFARYKDIDNDGVTYRTLPGTDHDKAAFFTRGTGHDDSAKYSENNEIYKKNLDRLKRKHQAVAQHLPPAYVEQKTQARLGIIAYGSSEPAVQESRHLLEQQGIPSSYYRPKALPLQNDMKTFIEQHEILIVIEQNRDAQLTQIMQNQYPELAAQLKPLVQYDGLPLSSEFILNQLQEWL